MSSPSEPLDVPHRRPPLARLFPVACIAALLCSVSLLVSPKVHDFSHDGRHLYVAARLLLTGQNPYDGAALREGYATYSPEGPGDRDWVMPPLLTPPGTLALAAGFAWLPWPIYWRLQLAFTACCIPATVYLCLRWIYEMPPIWLLAIGSGVATLFAPAWQNLILGQIALPVLAAALIAARATATNGRRPEMIGNAGVVGCVLASLAKFTCSVPLLIYLFVTSRARHRVAIFIGIAVFLVLNGLVILQIGVKQFTAGYQDGIRLSFAADAPNDIRGSGRAKRVDLASLTADLPQGWESATTWALGAVLVFGFVCCRPRRSQTTQRGVAGLAEVSALCVLALAIFYHRTYDAVLLLPAMVLAWACWRQRDILSAAVLTVALLTSFASIGNHNLVDLALEPMGLRQPPYFRALTVLLIYLANLMVLIRLPGTACAPRHSETPAEPAHG